MTAAPAPSAPLLIAVAETKYVVGLDQLDDQAPALSILPIETAFCTGWNTDAHFVCYQPVGCGDGAWPRFKKPVLPRIRLRGGDIRTQIFGFDYDTPEHKPWDPGLLAQFWEALAVASTREPLIDQFSLLYTTKSGARLVYILNEPIPVDASEAKHRWMVKAFGDAGLPVDKLSDWTRLFRLPFVIRDGRPTWDAANGMHFVPRWSNRILAHRIPSLEPQQVTEYGFIRQFTDPRPLDEEAQSLLRTFNDETGRSPMTSWFKAARNKLKGRECEACIFDGAPIAPQGGRDTTLHRYVGMATAMLMTTPGTTPQHIYALFLDSVNQLQPDQGTPSWPEALWSHVGRIWAREEAKVRSDQQQEVAKAENALTTIDNIVAGMKKWCTHPNLYADEGTARQFAATHMIASCGQNYFLMRPDGWYDAAPLNSVQVPCRVRELGMDGLVQTIEPSDSGPKVINIATLMAQHGTIISALEGQPSIKGGYIKLVDNASSVLVLPSYRRNPNLKPEYSPQVDDWMRQFFGHRYNEGCEWVSQALAFEDGPICSISIKSDPGTGKKIFVEGLAECLERPCIATDNDIVTNNQYGLLQSPFLVVDEGWSQGQSQGLHPADAFRRLISGQAFDCKRKWVAPVRVKNPIRGIITANNIGVVQMLTSNKDLSPQDREALRIRLKHFDLGDRAAIWLRQKGGMAFTGSEGNRWISADGADNSDFVVARHFLWLYENRDRDKIVTTRGGLRFLVEGDASPELMFEMRTNTGSTPIVIECIIKLLNQNGTMDGLVIQDHRLFVLAFQILEYYRANMAGSSRERLTSNVIGQVLENLILHDHGPITLRDKPHLTKRRWKELDPALLLAFARRDGWSCKKLEQLVEDRALQGIAPILEAQVA